MLRLPFCASVCALACAVAGCGKPLPERLQPEEQLCIDAGWNNAFAPVGRLDHQGLLDVMIATGIYERGVDFLSMTSEKRFAGGKAVMEVYYEREKPELDRFVVSIHDAGGKLLRSNKYDRREVELTWQDLHNPLPRDGTQDEEAARTKACELRKSRIREMFPDPPHK